MARIAFIVDDLFEDSEFRGPYDRLRAAGNECVVVGREKRELHGKQGKERVTPDLTVRDVTTDEFDALVVPGGYSPDKLRTDVKMVNLVREMVIRGKPVAAICHAGWMLASAGIIKGKRVTCFFSIKDDVVNAGGEYEDSEVVQDGNIITSRQPDDLPAFCRTIISALS